MLVARLVWRPSWGNQRALGGADIGLRDQAHISDLATTPVCGVRSRAYRQSATHALSNGSPRPNAPALIAALDAADPNGDILPVAR